MPSQHPIRDRIESVEKSCEQLIQKAQTNLPGAEAMITAAKKVGSPVLKGVRKLGDPVVDVLDSSISNAAKNGTAIYNSGSEFAQMKKQQGVEAAFHVADRVLTPPPDEQKQPKTIYGLFIHILNRLRYLSATKIKPVLKFDPYQLTEGIIMIWWAVIQLLLLPFRWAREQITPPVLWMLGHQCQSQPNGVYHGSGSGSSSGNDDQHRDRDSDEVDERSSSGSNASSGRTSGGGGGAHCSTGSGSGAGTRRGKRSQSRGTGGGGGSGHVHSAKANSSGGDTHDDI